MRYLDYIFYVLALITLILSVTSVVMNVVEWCGIANLSVWTVATFVSYGIVHLAKEELKEHEDDEL